MVGVMFVVATGCADACPSVALDDCIENSVLLQQGVYGRVVSSSHAQRLALHDERDFNLERRTPPSIGACE
jgi:hypothetical protein